MKRKSLKILAVVFSIIILGATGFWYYVKTSAFMESAGQKVSSVATEVLGVQVDVGAIEVKSLRTLELHDLAIYDKQAEVIARADKAQVTYRLLSALSAPADAVKEVTLSHVTAVVEQRDDGSWNYEDVASAQPSSQQFHGIVRVEDGQVTGRLQGQEIVLTNVKGSLDFADYPAMKAEVAAVHKGAAIEGKGTFDDARQIFNVAIKNVDIKDYLGWLPAGTLPEEVTIAGGRISQSELHVFRDGSQLSFSGEADLTDGALRVMDTDITGIKGHTAFTDAEVLLSVEAEAGGQQASAHGKIRLDTGKPYMDLDVASEAFDPGKVLTNIPYQGAAAFKAKLKGTFQNPLVDGEVKVEAGTALSVPFQNLSAKVRYQDGHLFAQDLRADLLGGHIEGEAALSTLDLSYTAHVQAKGLDMVKAAAFIPAVSAVTGRVSGDIGVSGKGTDWENMQAYGNAKLQDGTYKALPIENLNGSFYLAGDDLAIDFVSMNLPGKSRLGIEGTVTDVLTAPQLDLAFYGAHFDLALLSKLEPQADLTGISDFKGTVQGPAANPQVELKFSGLNGTLFKQPFDSLKLMASGSLDGIHIDDFLMEKNGKEVWRVAGSVGFTGERRLNLQIDTMGARMEDIAALVAPDQPITGNVDNIITFTGTLDNPKGVGYIHFYRGSYHGVLLSGMDGDYFLENGIIRLQDFHAYSPMIDMVLNGTIDRNQNLNMEVAARDIDLKRVEHKLPYEVSGHGTFKGLIRGRISSPEFYGTLEAASLILNEQEITNLHGLVKYRRGIADLDKFRFEQNGGTYDVTASVNTETEALTGNVTIANADINALSALCNLKNDLVQGRLDCTAEVKGTISNPQVKLTGAMAKGTVGDYDVHDAAFDLRLLDKVLYVDKFAACQGDTGLLTLSGSAGLDGGPLAARLSATNLSMGMFAQMAGIQTEVIGTADIEAVFGGVLTNPSADVTIKGRNGGVQGSTFDSLDGQLHLKNGLVQVDTLNVKKTAGERTYQASAQGIVPLRAVFAHKDEQLDDIEQIQMTVGLDQADLSLLPTLSKEIDWAVGATTGSLKIRGTLAHPRVDGTLGVADGAVKFKAIATPVTDMNAQIVFDGSQMTVREFSGKMGDGTYTLTGNIQFDGVTPKKYDLALKFNKLDIQSGVFTGPLTGEFRVFDTDFYGHTLPKIYGQIDFDNCLISVPAIPDSDGAMPEAVLDVQVNVGRKVHFYSPYLYDMYLTGQVHAGGIVSHPKMSGSLEVKRGGTINYLKTEFAIREGRATFDQVASFLPSIDFFADTKLTRTRVFLAAKGPLGNMQIKLSSSPPMSQTQIIQLLTLRDAYKNGQANMTAGDLLTVGLQMSFLSEVEGAMRDFLYLDQFAISRGSGSAFDHREKENDRNKYDFNVQMGKYISDKVMLKYTRSLGGSTNVNRYGIQYDFNDRLGMTLEREGNDYIVGFEARTSF
ncbi:translocation and assembly module TamB [Selenomonas sp. GACV-9]|uniref:translocation/assembly module TamB domain-containing protein n=1 Tax=Selenomonas sp. GACV-9 TaxID=3158782 RepID=UPI0008EC0183|nr:translocation and assembly module TamB [Selenomonas ruminantium]